MSAWRSTTLGRLEAESGGTIQTGPFGSQLHMDDYSRQGTPVVMPTNIRELRIDDTGIARVAQNHVDRLSRHQLRGGDIVYSRRGDVEKCALVLEDQAGWLCGTGCLLVRVGGDHVDSRFLAYALSLPQTRAWIVQHAVGATMPNLNTDILREVPVELPPIDEQRPIAATLGALDDKIDSNRRVVETGWALLAAEYQALQGRAPAIPLGDILDLAYGKALPADCREPGDVPVYGSNGVTGCHATALVEGPVVIVGRKGSVGEVHWSSTSCWPIDTTFYAQPRDGIPPLLAFFALKAAGLTRMNSDSAIPGLNRTAALAVRVPVPLAEGEAWSAARQSLLKAIDQRQSETHNLAALRDALLPELLSGRIGATINEVET